MKKELFQLVMSGAVINLFCCLIAVAEPIDDYIKFQEEKYYLLDKQNYSKITCNVNAPLLKQQVGQVKNQLKGIPVGINDTLSEFIMIYSKGGGLRFNKPYIDIKVLSSEGIKDEGNFYKGIAQIKSGFSQQVDGLVQILEGIFAEFMTPDNVNDKVKTFTKTSDEVKVVLEKGGGVYEETYTGNIRRTDIRTSQLQGQSVDEFQNMDGHLMLVKANLNMDQQGFGSMSTVIEIAYQKIGDILFPSKISQNFMNESNGIKQQGTIDIFLENCTVE